MSKDAKGAAALFSRFNKAALLSASALASAAISAPAVAQDSGAPSLILGMPRGVPETGLPDITLSPFRGSAKDIRLAAPAAASDAGPAAPLVSTLANPLAGTTPLTLTVTRELPVAPEVVYGTVNFGRSVPGTLTVQQATSKAIVNWQSFDIASGNSVDVRQPDAQSRALFRVTGNTDSLIAGTLTANGKIFLINPNGIAIGGGAKINTGSFVASTLDIADADFLSGNFTFRRTGAAKGIYNGGTITANGGDVALIGSAIVNEGVVSARLGRIAYGAGDAVTLDFSGDRFLSIALPVSDLGDLKDV